MASNRDYSDHEDDCSDREDEPSQRPSDTRGGLDVDTEQSRFLRQLNQRLDVMQQNQITQNDRMCEIVGKIDGGEELEYEWKKKGLKIQYQTANKVLKKCRSASSALKAD